MQITAADLSAAAGIALALIFNYVPRVDEWYAVQDRKTKSFIMLLALLGVAVGAAVLSCANIVAFVLCERSDFILLGRVFLAALVANQGTYLISPPSRKVEQLRFERAVRTMPSPIGGATLTRK